MEVPGTNANIAEIWAKVLRTHTPIEVEDRPGSTLDGMNNAGSFQSVRESQKSDESEDIPDQEIVLEAIEGSLLRGMQERFKVKNVKN
ncbi:hypothetical protein FRC06_008881, partial [Ceratobasidium sp. 370]